MIHFFGKRSLPPSEQAAQFSHTRLSGVQFFTFSHPRLHLLIGSLQNYMYMESKRNCCLWLCVGCTQLWGCCCCVLGVVDTTQPGALSCWATTRPYLYKKMRAAKDTPCFVYHLHRGHRHSSSSSSAGAQAVPLCRRCSSLSLAACQLPAERELIDAPEIALLACEGGFACGKTPSTETR
jgi:hypothetical protein